MWRVLYVSESVREGGIRSQNDADVAIITKP